MIQNGPRLQLVSTIVGLEVLVVEELHPKLVWVTLTQYDVLYTYLRY